MKGLAVMSIDRPLRFTFIDDDRGIVAEFLRQLDADRHAEIQTISSSPFLDEFLEKTIARFEPDLIVLDLFLQIDTLSGERILRGLRRSERLRGIGVVLLSSFLDEGHKIVRKYEHSLRDAISKTDPEWREKLWRYALQAAEAKR